MSREIEVSPSGTSISYRPASKQPCSASNPDCVIKTEKGKGSFKGFTLELCTVHQIIISTKRQFPKTP